MWTSIMREQALPELHEEQDSHELTDGGADLPVAVFEDLDAPTPPGSEPDLTPSPGPAVPADLFTVPLPRPHSAPTCNPIPSRQLIWHLCQLCNAMTCGLSEYLSLECLSRDLLNSQGTPSIYMAPLQNRATLLLDLGYHLSNAVESMMRSRDHPQLLARGAYRSLLRASHCLPRVAIWVPHPRFARLPVQYEVRELRKGVAEATVLMEGDAEQGVVSWKECWDDSAPFDVWH